MNSRTNITAEGRRTLIRNAGIRAFTLIELLVVIAVIGLLAKVALPAIRGLTKSNAMIAANRQMLDDLAYARRTAIANRSTVYMVFIPPWIWQDNQYLITGSQYTDQKSRTLLTNLYKGQYTTYALISLRSVGDQPGSSTPRYLTEWRSLPKGVFFATNKFMLYSWKGPNSRTNEYGRAFPCDKYPDGFAPYSGPLFPFPSVLSGMTVSNLPCIGFDFLGRLVSPNFENEAIGLSRGSIFYTSAADGTFQPQQADLVETPPQNGTNSDPNYIHIDFLTGKARVERTEVQ